jgi:hypothetical protein
MQGSKRPTAQAAAASPEPRPIFVRVERTTTTLPAFISNLLSLARDCQLGGAEFA